MPETAYAARSLTLQPGDGLFVYSDGITEAENANGEQFGKARLAQCLIRLSIESSAAEILDGVRAELGAFVGAAQPSDDLTLLIVRWFCGNLPSTPDRVPAPALSAP